MAVARTDDRPVHVILKDLARNTLQGYNSATIESDRRTMSKVHVSSYTQASTVDKFTEVSFQGVNEIIEGLCVDYALSDTVKAQLKRFKFGRLYEKHVDFVSFCYRNPEEKSHATTGLFVTCKQGYDNYDVAFALLKADFELTCPNWRSVSHEEVERFFEVEGIKKLQRKIC